MPTRPEDFWPSGFPTVQEESLPVALLREQAALLSEKTGDLVQSVVRNSVIEGTVYHSLYLRAPALGDYMFKVLSISHPVSSGGEDPFPLEVVISAGPGAPQQVANMKEFKTWLRDALSTDKVIATVSTLIEHSKLVLSGS